MSKRTLLEMTQNILNEMDSDEVNSIDDTIEAQQVASIIKSCYFKMIGNRNWPHLKQLIQLDALNDPDKPTYLKLPNYTKELLYVSYDAVKTGEDVLKYTEVKYRYPDEFLRMTLSRRSDNDNVETITDFSGTKLLVINDKAPQFWTSFDDVHLVFDSYDSSVDDTLKQAKNQCVAYMEPTWEHTNEAIPNLPSEAFPALEEEAKSVAFLTLKQMVNSKAEQASVKQQAWLSRKAWAAKGGVRYANFGRVSRK